MIQGTADADVGNKVTRDKVSKTIDFCLGASQPAINGEKNGVLEENSNLRESQDLDKLTDDELDILNAILAKKNDVLSVDGFSSSIIDGLTPTLERGSLGLAITVVEGQTSK